MAYQDPETAARESIPPVFARTLAVALAPGGDYAVVLLGANELPDLYPYQVICRRSRYGWEDGASANGPGWTSVSGDIGVETYWGKRCDSILTIVDAQPGFSTRRSSDPSVRPRRLAPMSLHLFAGLRVRDYEAARRWYEQLLGEPSFFPHDTEAVWTLAEDRSVYVVQHPEGAGSSVVTIWVDDLDAHVSAIAARGLEPDEHETYSNGVRKAVYRDADGNEVGFAGAPLDPAS